MFKGMGDIMKQAQQMQEKMQQVQDEVARIMVHGESGAGLVKITMLGNGDVKQVNIDPSLLSEEKEILEDLVAAAVNDAVRKSEQAKQEKMAEITNGLNLPPGFKLPF